MGHYPFGLQSAGDATLFLGIMYLFVLFILTWSVFGLVRTAATRLPIPPTDDSLWGLYPFDVMSAKLYSFTGRGRKRLKLWQLGGWLAIGLGSWWAVLYASYEKQLYWFGWKLDISPWLVVAGHVVVVSAIAAPFVRRAITHANRYPPLRAVK